MNEEVPASGDVVGERRSRSYFSRQTEIAQFDGVSAVAEDVLRFQIAVEEAVFVHVSQSFNYLQQDVPQRRFRHGFIPF